MGMGMGMGGMGIMPMMSAMNPSASLSPTDAAALGMQGSGNGLGMNPMNGVFMNPMAAAVSAGLSDVDQPDRRDDADEPDGNVGAGLGAIERRTAGRGPGSEAGPRQPRREDRAAPPRRPGTGVAVFQPDRQRQPTRERQPDSAELLRPAKSLLSASCPVSEIRVVFDLSERAIVPIVSLVKSDPVRNGSAFSCGSESNCEQAGFHRNWDHWELSPEGESDSPLRTPVRPMSECREDVLHGSRKE